MTQYRGMIIVKETDGNKSAYRVIRFKLDGTASATPWKFGSMESAQSYVQHHGF